MPGFDGTGPQGQGPMSGRGEGYCALVLPVPEEGKRPYGYAGVQGTPVGLETPTLRPSLGSPTSGWLAGETRVGRASRRGQGRRRGRRRGRW
jgi:hypothetical protein